MRYHALPKFSYHVLPTAAAKHVRWHEQSKRSCHSASWRVVAHRPVTEKLERKSNIIWPAQDRSQSYLQLLSQQRKKSHECSSFRRALRNCNDVVLDWCSSDHHTEASFRTSSEWLFFFKRLRSRHARPTRITTNMQWGQQGQRPRSYDRWIWTCTRGKTNANSVPMCAILAPKVLIDTVPRRWSRIRTIEQGDVLELWL